MDELQHSVLKNSPSCCVQSQHPESPHIIEFCRADSVQIGTGREKL